uniref:Transcriptional regulator, PadR family n=1 Tax=Rhodopseudomonas palustris (strain BisA53) TaxID=316055 RepID=Q07JI0_RHOP5
MNISEDNAPQLEPGMAGCRGGRRGACGHGKGAGQGMRAGRMLGQGDLKLIVLALIAEQPRHGYDVIKVVEDRAGGRYAPSPGVVYPTLALLEDVGHLTSQPDGAKKLYVITEQGRAYLADQRAGAEAIFSRLAGFATGALPMRRRNRAGRGNAENADLPWLVRAALDNLRDTAGKRLNQDPDTEAEMVAIVARAAGELRKV